MSSNVVEYGLFELPVKYHTGIHDSISYLCINIFFLQYYHNTNNIFTNTLFALRLHCSLFTSITWHFVKLLYNCNCNYGLTVNFGPGRVLVDATLLRVIVPFSLRQSRGNPLRKSGVIMQVVTLFVFKLLHYTRRHVWGKMSWGWELNAIALKKVKTDKEICFYLHKIAKNW